MTADAVTSVLEAELASGELLEVTLERQREALLRRDLDRINELTDTLEGQMEHFGTLVETRSYALDGRAPVDERSADLLRRVRRTEKRVLRLAEINQDLIADRLACVGALLSTLGLSDPGGYGVEPHPQTMSRSA